MAGPVPAAPSGACGARSPALTMPGGVDGDRAEGLGGDALGRDAARGERGADRRA